MMTQQSFQFTDLSDWESLKNESIELSPEQIDRAVHMAQPIPNALQQWQTYLHALALAGFKQWLEEWAPDLSVDDSNCSLYQPSYATLIAPICRLQVGHFTVGLMAVSSLADAMIHLPRVVVDLPSFVPHLYVLVEAQEEQMQVHIHGYLRHDQFVAHQQATPSLRTSGWSYVIPLEWFDPSRDALLLDLRFLDVTVIPLPTVSPLHLIPLSQLQPTLIERLPQLRSPNIALQQCLSWQEGATILAHADLVDWLYQVQQSATLAPSITATLQQGLTDILQRLQPLAQRAINVGLWLRDQLDTVAQDLSWVLLPTLAPATSALRSTVSGIEQVVAALQGSEVTIAPDARGAFRDLRWGQVALRLYVITWALPPVDTAPEWVLLLALGAQSPSRMPRGIRLQIRDGDRLLLERVVTEGTQDTYVYAQVVGNWDEQFWVTIDLTNGAIVTFPFAFQLDDLP